MPSRSKNYSAYMPLRIKSMRLVHGYTQKALADILFKSESTVRMWELGKSEPDSETINAMSELFGISTDYLLGKPFDLAVPMEQWHRSLREDYEREEPALQEYLMFKYGKGYFPKTEKMPSAPEGTEGMGENEKRLFAIWNRIPEENKPEILNLIEIALHMQQGNSNE